MIRQLLAALAIDPVALSPNDSHEPLEPNLLLAIKPRLYKSTWPFARAARGLVFLWMTFKQSVKSLARGLWRRQDVSEGSYLFVSFSQNQAVSLDPIVEQLRAKGAIVVHQSTFHAPDQSVLRLLPQAHWLALPFLPILLWRMIREKGYRGRSFRWALDTYWLNYGLYVATRCWLKKQSVAAVVVSNDHRNVPCVMTAAARAEGIATFYVQHASVTDRFPPLRVDYALLDGRDALEKYAGAGPTQTTALLIGMTKQDGSAGESRERSMFDSIGVCLSKADDYQQTQELLAGLSEMRGTLAVTVRTHPSIMQQDLQPILELCEQYGYDHSSKAESAFDFLGRMDAVIAGVSGISLEAVLLNVVPISFPLNDGNNDWYGFLEHGLCEVCNNLQELETCLANLRLCRPDVQERAKWYCATIGTPYEGRSAYLAAELISSDAMERTCEELGLHRIEEESRLEAYEIR